MKKRTAEYRAVLLKWWVGEQGERRKSGMRRKMRVGGGNGEENPQNELTGIGAILNSS